MTNEHDEIKTYAKLQSDVLDVHLKLDEPISQYAIELHCYKCLHFRHSDAHYNKHLCHNLYVNKLFIDSSTIKECKAKGCKDIVSDKQYTININNDVTNKLPGLHIGFDPDTNSESHCVLTLWRPRVNKPKADTLSSLWYELIQTLITKEEKQTMTAEQTLKVLEAIKAGKEVLVSGDGVHWVKFKYDPKNIDMNTQAYIYKVAPEYRPYNKEELNVLFCDRIRHKASGITYMITGVDPALCRVYFANNWYATKDLIASWEHLNGEPFGVQVDA